MASNAVPGFLPSRYGFRFRNQWPSNPARRIGLGPIAIPIGDTGRGLCGGMAFCARVRFERGEDAPTDVSPPEPGTDLFVEIVDRQFASFGSFFSVPIRFYLASISNQDARTRETVRDAWPAIKAALDAGVAPMVGLIRLSGWNPLALGLGHQVVAFRYDETPTRLEIGIYDPNHELADDVSVIIEKTADGTYAMRQTTGEVVIGLLSLPFSAER